MSTSAHIPSEQRPKSGIGSVHYLFRILDSTNTFAAKLLTQSSPGHGTVISAGLQTSGRGQIGRTWFGARSQSLCLSVILYPTIRPQDQFYLNMAVSLSVRETIHHFCPEPRIQVKWPNDIYADDRKIAGILIQNTIQGNSITSCIVGIGINVNNPEFPDDLPNPVSMLQVNGSGTPFELTDIRDVLFSSLTARLDAAENARGTLQQDYLTHLYRRNQLSRFKRTSDGSTFEGTILHPEPSGSLVISHVDGTEEVFQFREIELLHDIPSVVENSTNRD